MIAFVGCVKSKKDHPCKAEEMYTSNLFKKGLAYAKKTRAKCIFYLRDMAWLNLMKLFRLIKKL